MLTVELLEDRDEEGERLAAARLGGTEYVMAFEGEGNGAGLNVGQDLEMGGPQAGCCGGRERKMSEVLNFSGFRVLEMSQSPSISLPLS